MTIARDTFGEALLEAFEGGAGRHMIERDDGRQDWMDAASYFTDVNAWPAPVADALAGLHGHVLDVGCGAGRHALHLAGRGCDVVGIDPSPLAVEISRRRGVRAVVGRLGDADLSAHEPFDGVVMLGHNLGLLEVVVEWNHPLELPVETPCPSRPSTDLIAVASRQRQPCVPTGQTSIAALTRVVLPRRRIAGILARLACRTCRPAEREPGHRPCGVAGSAG